MGECVDKLPHSCGASQALQVFQQEDGTVDGYCFACGTIVDDPYGDKPIPKYSPKTQAQRDEEVSEIKDYPCHALPTRKLKRESLKYFGVRMQVSQTDGKTPTASMFPYGTTGNLTGWRVATLGERKQQWCIGTTKGANFFGWGRAVLSGQRTLYITEGEYDAIALYQILKDGNKRTEWADDDPAVVSLVHGASSAKKDVARMLPEIRKHFEDVVLVFDMDEPGRKAAEDVCRIAPAFKSAELPCKDANACLMEGASKACKSAVVFRASKPKNTRLVYGSSLRDVARTEAEWGLSWPWEGLTQATRGIRRGETIYLGAGVKMGKSELVNAIASHMILEHDLPVLIVKPEEALAKSYKMVVGKAAGKIFHDPKIPFDYKAFDKAEKRIGDKAIFQDIYQFVNWESLKSDIQYAVVTDGVKDVILDPITCFTNNMSASEANEHLTYLAADLSSLAKDMDFTAYIFCHLLKPATGEPHERGGKVHSSQFAGSRAMMRSCNYMIGMHGNKDPELSKEQRNIRTLEILEDREFGAADSIPLYWDDRTGLFNEIRS